MIHILDYKTEQIVDTLENKSGGKKVFWNDEHHEELRTNTETFDFITTAQSEFLTSKNLILIVDEDGYFRPFSIWRTRQLIDGSLEVQTNLDHFNLRTQKVIAPITYNGQTINTILDAILDGTDWKRGITETNNLKTVVIEDYTNPLSVLHNLKSLFELELRFRCEIVGNKIVGRYVDMLRKIGDYRGKEIVLGKDLQDIERIEESDKIVTALWVVGQEDSNGNPISISSVNNGKDYVEDLDALERWGKNGRHIWDVYIPVSSSSDMTPTELLTLAQAELKKRINSVVSYNTTAVDLENVFGLSHEKVRLGDTVRIKDEKFIPPLYMDARVIDIRRSTIDKSKKEYVIGDFIEYKKEDLEKRVKFLKDLMDDKLSKLILATVTSSAGNVFKNGIGSTTLTAKTFLNGIEVDNGGTDYTYKWSKRDKDGNTVTFNPTGKSITVISSEVIEKATYIVEILITDKVSQVAQITISNVNDGTNGQPGDDGLTPYFHTAWATNSTGTTGFSTTDSTNKTYIGTYSDYLVTASTDPTKYKWVLIKGADGVTTYTWRKYADDELGNGMSDSSNDKRYLGLAFNKTTETKSNTASDYTWSPLYDNVEAGMTNILTDSYLQRVLAHSAANGTFSRTESKPTDLAKVTSTGAGTTFGIVLVTADRTINYLSNQSYMITFEARGTISAFDYLYMMRNSSEGVNAPMPAQSVALSTTEWTKVTVPMVAPWTTNTGYVLIGSRDSAAGKWFEIRKLKIEKGNIATDWSPNPDEVVQVSRLYNGVSITEADGFKSVRSDNKVQTVQNATKGIFIQKRAAVTDPWKDVFFVDTDDTLAMAGKIKAINGSEYIQIDGTSIQGFYGAYGSAGRTLFRLDDTFPSMYDGNQVSSKVEGYGKMYSQRVQFWVPARAYAVGDYLEMTIPIKNHDIMGMQVVSIIKCQSVIKEMYAYEKKDSRVFSSADLQSFVLRLSPYYAHTIATGFYADVDIMVIGWR